ncbi:DUF1616 domain-containing protein [Halobaculum limi]|uniref:DUF1616 domain-containing protein n=1 Tax=Halobaculum limi TaxID=3031916 RepID=UPI00240758D2|nr:DUF1616 domain-containing protein [Halobaculum sp. YSMS11]
MSGAIGRGPGSVLDRLPGDAPLVAGYTIIAGGLIALGGVGGPLRVLLAAPLVGFLPGYALLSVLFPDDRPVQPGRPPAWRLPLADGLGWFERCTLSVPTSIAVLPLFVIVLAVAGVPFTTIPVVLALSAFVILVTIAGAVRRIRTPDDSRYDIPVDRWFREVKSAWLPSSDRPALDRALGVLVFVVALAAVSGLALGFAAPNDGESYTEVALLTQGPDGLVAGNFPDQVAAGTATDFVVTIDNRLGTAADYEVVVVLDRVRVQESGESLVVLERSELSRFGVSVSDGQQAQQDVTVQPNLIGEDLRMSVFVYQGEAPESPSENTADHHLYLWVDVN